MTESRVERTKKKQLGQFMTPESLSKDIVSKIFININSKILEPSFGDGSFIFAIIEKLLEQNIPLSVILKDILYGVEIDTSLYNSTLEKLEFKYGKLPKHNLINGDFFEEHEIFNIKYTNIIGNPPFGGTIDYKYQDKLDSIYGKRDGNKIKKETYSFFMVKSLDLLDDYGKISFICSDTFLSIKTMSGLRKFLFKTGFNNITTLEVFSEETKYPMLIINFEKNVIKDHLLLNDVKLSEDLINITPNYSWFMEEKFAEYFSGDSLSKYITASGGLCTGKNEYFLRTIKNNKIIEKYEFEYYQDPITLTNELSKAKLNKIGDKKKESILIQEQNKETFENVKISNIEPFDISLPNENYCFYNKATTDIFYSDPKTVIYWKDNGKAVLTFKKNSNWYLHGVGGQPFFKKECITWQLISKKINVRYLPTGYILDNSSPVAILKSGVNHSELFFILGWLLTDKASEIQKTVINHTKNIQNKDIERLPYPFWVSNENKNKIIDIVKNSIKMKIEQQQIDEINILIKLNELFKL